MTGPYHYSRAEEILAEIETTNALSNETETALAIRAQAHATLALAAATAIDPDRQRGKVARRRGSQVHGRLATLQPARPPGRSLCKSVDAHDSWRSGADATRH